MPRRQKLVLAGLILAGFAMFVFAGLVSDGDGSDMSVSQNPAIDRIIPNRGDEVLQQQTVGIDLASGYRLVRLTISPDEACRFPVDVAENGAVPEGRFGDGDVRSQIELDFTVVFCVLGAEFAHGSDPLGAQKRVGHRERA